MESELPEFFTVKIAEAEAILATAKENLHMWKQARDAYLDATRTSQLPQLADLAVLHATLQAPRQENQFVAPIIKQAIASFTPGRLFTTREVFNLILEHAPHVVPNKDYYRLRPSISAWLQKWVKEQKIERLDRGLYRVVKEG
jgi:hypothetical protein